MGLKVLSPPIVLIEIIARDPATFPVNSPITWSPFSFYLLLDEAMHS
jgi:hypothetical protein